MALKPEQMSYWLLAPSLTFSLAPSGEHPLGQADVGWNGLGGWPWNPADSRADICSMIHPVFSAFDVIVLSSIRPTLKGPRDLPTGLERWS